MVKLKRKKYNTILTEKQQKKSGKIDRYEYLTGEEILPPNRRQIIE